MLTSTHILLAAGLVGRPRFNKWQVALAWAGGLFPDLSVIVMVAFSRMIGTDFRNTWRKPDGLYWSEPWQTYSAISNSIPLYAFGLLVGLVLYRGVERAKGLAIGLMVFCSGALLHVCADFLVHTDDAHVHFWPFTSWRFHSAVSYYQSDHYGDWVSMLEVVMGAAMIFVLFAGFKSWWVRAPALVLALPYIISVRFLF